MLSALNPFGGSEPEPAPPSPDLLWTWNRSELMAALQTGDCSALHGRLPELLAAVSQDPNAATAYVETATTACGGFVPFIATVLMLHSGSPSAARFCTAATVGIATSLPRGALVPLLRGTVDALGTLRSVADGIDAENAQKWFYQRKADKDITALEHGVIALGLVASDVLASEIALSAAGPSVRRGLERAAELAAALPFEGPQLPAALRTVLNAIQLALARPAAELTVDVEAFMAFGFALAAKTKRRLYSTDASVASKAACECLSGRWTKSGVVARTAAAEFLHSSFKLQVLPATSAHATALGNALRWSVLHVSASRVTIAVLRTVGDFFSSNAFPTRQELDQSGLFDFVGTELAGSLERRDDIPAAARLCQSLYGLALSKTVPKDVAALLRRVAVTVAAALAEKVWRLWPLGPSALPPDDGPQLIEAVRCVTAVTSRAVGALSATAADGAEAVLTPQRLDALWCECRRAATSSAFFYHDAVVSLGWVVLGALPHGGAGSACAFVDGAATHLWRCVANFDDATSDTTAATAAASAVEAIGRGLLQPYATPAVGSAVVQAAVRAMEAASSRSPPWSAAVESAARVLSAAAAHLAGRDAVTGMSLRDLRALARAYQRDRGWVTDGAAALTIDALVGDAATPSPLRAALRLRRDAVQGIAQRDPTDHRRSVIAVLSVQARWRARSGPDATMPRAVSRRIFDFSGNGAAVAKAFGATRGGQLLVAVTGI